MATLEDGRSIEQYRIIRWLGSGASGECYEAEDTIQLRKVTLKLVHPWARLTESARRQFFREMQGISGLNHPYLATILDYGESGNYLYIARRYASPGSLLGQQGRAWFRFPLAPADAILYAHQLAQALQTIHSQGYIHGSLTLSNILVLRGPNLDQEPDFAPFLLADVGITNFARRFGQLSQATPPLTFAPEQFGGRLIDASDQYALAVLLCLWLTGRPPFIGSAEEIEYHKLTSTIQPLHQLNARVTLRQEGILLRALSVYPDERYPSILAFTEALLSSLDTPAQVMPIEHVSVPAPHNGVMHSTPAQAVVIAEQLPMLLPPRENPPPSPTTPPLENTTSLLKTALPTNILPAEGQASALSPVEQSDPPHVPIEAYEEHAPVEVYEEDEVGIERTPQPYLLAYLPQIAAALTFPLVGDTIAIGRAGSSDIVLDQDGSISRHHAILKREQTGYTIYDQRSTLGVIVNGTPLAEGVGHLLTPHDQVTIGAYTLKLEWHTEASRPEYNA